MRSFTKHLFRLSLSVLFISAISLIPSFSGNAQAQSCTIAICKSAEGAGGILFPFTAEQGGSSENFVLAPIEQMGACRLVNFNSSSALDVFEDARPGWQLDHVECEEVPGIFFSLIEGGVDLACVGNGGSGTCTFFNVPGGSAATIPTLSEWGMIAAFVGLGLVGVFFALRRRRAFNS